MFRRVVEFEGGRHAIQTVEMTNTLIVVTKDSEFVLPPIAGNKHAMLHFLPVDGATAKLLSPDRSSPIKRGTSEPTTETEFSESKVTIVIGLDAWHVAS